MPFNPIQFKSKKAYLNAYGLLSSYRKFGFKGKGGTFTPAQKAAITKRARAMGMPFVVALNAYKSGERKFDYVQTRNRKTLATAAAIWGESLVDSQGFFVPRGGDLQRGIKTARVHVDRFGNIQRTIYPSKREFRGREVRTGSWEVYFPIDEESLLEDEADYLTRLAAPYIEPTKRQRAAFPDLAWGSMIPRGEGGLRRFAPLVWGDVAKEFSDLANLIERFQRYISDRIQADEDDDPIRLNGILGVRP